MSPNVTAPIQKKKKCRYPLLASNSCLQIQLSRSRRLQFHHVLSSPHFLRNLLTNSTTGFYVYSLYYFTFLHFLWLIETGLKTKVTKFKFIPLLFCYKVDVLFCEELHSIALFSLCNLQLFFTVAVLDFSLELQRKQYIIFIKFPV